MDVKSTFHHGNLKEEIFMEPPNKFTQPIIDNLVCKLKKLVYGLKQSPRKWYKRFDFYIFLIMYMDDMLTIVKSMFEVDKLKSLMCEKFVKKDLRTAKTFFRYGHS